MAQNLSLSGQIVVTNGGLRNIITLNDTLNTTSSTAIVNNQTVVTGSWQVVDSGSNTNLRFIYLSNTDTTSSVKIAFGNTTSLASVLQPTDFCILTYTGSTTIYAQATGSNASVVLQYLYLGN